MFSKKVLKKGLKKDVNDIDSRLQKLIHQLEVYQVKLELQNEELNLSNSAAQDAIYLYDFAPSGFFTLSKKGEILELNLTGSQFFGQERSSLKNCLFGFFVSDSSKAVFNLFLEEIFTDNVKKSCEVTLSVKEDLTAHVHLTGIITEDEERCLVTMVDITRHVQSEETLRKSEERHHAIIETAMDGFWRVNRTGHLIEVNNTYCRMSGYSSQELLTMHISDLEVLESADEVADHIRRILAKREDRFETRHRHKDGSIFEVEVSAQYQPDEGGQLVVFLHDIHDRKLAEDNLRQSEERYKSLFKDNHSVMLLIDPDTGEIRDANPAASRYYGWTHAELCGKIITEINSLSKEEVAGEMQKAKEQKRSHFFFKHRLADGEIRDVEVYSGPIKFNGTTLLYSIVHDITERKLVEEALKESERLLRESQQVAHIGCYEVDLTTRTWKASPEINRIFGIDESYPHTLEAWTRLIHPDSRESVFEHNLQVELEKKQFNHEYKIVRFNDGKVHWVHGLGELEFDDQMRPVKLLGTIQDITHHKQAEEALNQLNEELEARVKERTSELLISHDALKQTEEKYRTVADHTYDWEYWINAEGAIQYISPSVVRVTGYTAEEIIANPGLINQIVFKDDLRFWERHVVESHTPDPDEKNNELEFRIVSKSGDIRWIGHVCKRIFVDGQYLGIRVSNHDVTGRVTAENELLNITVAVEERERKHFSRALHDGMGPLLSIIKLYFQWLAETDDAEKRKIIIEKGNINIEKAIETSHEIVLGLNSLFLNNSGYVEAIEKFIQNINNTQKLSIHFIYNTKQSFGNFLEITLYRITVELINNTLKYASATRIEIELKYNERKSVAFTYSEDGTGFDLPNTEKENKGMGLITIQQRIKIMRGKIKIDTGIGKGMKVYIEIPVSETII